VNRLEVAGMQAMMARLLKIQPKRSTAKHAKVAKAHQLLTGGGPARRGSAAGGRRLGQKDPGCATFRLLLFL
jgi:hypothetical protein